MSFNETFVINYYYHYRYCTLTVEKKGFTEFGQKKLIKTCQKGGKIINLYKGENVNFFIMFKILSKLQELSCGKVK